MRSDLLSPRGHPVVAYVKDVGDGVLLYMEEVNKKRRDMTALSMRKYPARTDVMKILSNLPPDHYVQDGGGHVLNLSQYAERYNFRSSQDAGWMTGWFLQGYEKTKGCAWLDSTPGPIPGAIKSMQPLQTRWYKNPMVITIQVQFIL
jgi:hypothetical protein